MKTARKQLNRKLALTVAILLAILSCASIVYAATTLRARGKISVNTLTLDAKSEFSYGNNELQLSFSKPGEQQTLTVTTTNSTDSVLQISYALSITASDTANDSGDTVSADDNAKLAQAILVYLNGEYIGTLAELDSAARLQGAYVAECEDGTADADKPTVCDVLTFELHLGADESIFDGKTISLTTTAYTQSVDYEEYIFVESDADLVHAVDDINSGICAIVDKTSTDDNGTVTTARNVVYPQIVLLADVAFADGTEIKNPFNVNLNGHTLSGSVTLNGSSAYLWCTGSGTNSVTGTFTSYDTATVQTKLIASAQEALASGVEESTSQSLFGCNGFYVDDATNIEITEYTRNYTYSDGTVTASAVERSSVETISVCGTEMEFAVLDSETSLDATYLQNIPTDGETVVTSDMFLPTSIRSEGATIEWTSANPDIISDEGKIVAGKADKVAVTLYAAITVNGVTETKEFSFKVSAHTNEVNFYKMVADMSPIVIYETAGVSSSGEYTGRYELPVVSGGTYDYREDYKTPSLSSLWSLVNGNIPDDEVQLYSHEAYAEIFLESIAYSEVLGSDGTETYSYIDLATENGGYQVYLSSLTAASYAELSITGTFNTGDTYSSTVIIVIATGADTTIFDQAFASVSETLGQINVLKNILTTRTEDGVLAESGDFTMPATLTVSNITFTLSYSVAENATHADIIKSITSGSGGYVVELDLEKLSNVEATVPITVTATWSGVPKEQTLYFTAPAALHTEDLGNASIFNSVKYQVYQQLPSDEQLNIDSAFSVSGSAVTNNTPDYILLRDIVGDDNYQATYAWYTTADDEGNTNDYLVTNSNNTLTKHEGCKELWFYTADNSADYTDTYARDFASLINWATGKSEVSASSVVTNSSVNGTVLTDILATTADGQEYLTDDEIDVLKAYYQAATGVSDADWNSVWTTVAERATGYVMTDGAAVENLASQLITTAYPSDSTLYFKYTGVMEWATNFKDNTYNVNGQNGYESNRWASGVTGNPEQTKYNLVFTTDDNAPTDDGSVIYVTWKASGTWAKSETNAAYTYIATIDGVKWYYNTTIQNDGAQYLRYNINSYTTDISANTASDGSGTAITVETLYNTKIANYLDDDTDYITPGEAEVIFAFILSQTSNLSVEKGSDGSYTITKADDSTVHTDGFEAYVETFYASAIIPTYFTDEGVSLLMQYFYDGAEISVSTDTDNDGHYDSCKFVTAYKTAGEGTGSDEHNDGLSLVSVVEKVPAVANLEQVSSGLSYFSVLTQLYVEGTDDLPAFLSEYGLTTALSTVRKNAPNVSTLVLEHVADNYVSFALSDIKNFTSLTQIDVSNNAGVTNVNPLVNYLSDNYEYVDISKVDVEDEFCDFVLNNIQGTVYYGTARTARKGSSAGTIGSLSELANLISENMYLATDVTSKDDGSTTNTIFWRIESGNKITYVEYSLSNGGASMDEILAEANTHFGDLHYGEYYGMYFAYGGTSDNKYINGTIYRIMPNYANTAFVYVVANSTVGYYYCTSTFTCGAYTFAEGTVYCITFDATGAYVSEEIIKDGTSELVDVENGISDKVDHSGVDGGYSQESVDVTDYSETIAVSPVYNCLLLANGGYTSTDLYMFASGSTNTTIKAALKTKIGSNWGTDWNDYNAAKVCILTESDYAIVVGTDTTTKETALGVTSADEIVCSTLTYDSTNGWVITGSPVAYYLYFPQLNRWANSISSLSSGATVPGNQGSAANAGKFYICNYNGSYIFYSADTTDTTDLSSGPLVLGIKKSDIGSTSSTVSVYALPCISNGSLNMCCTWTIDSTVNNIANSAMKSAGWTFDVTYSDGTSETVTAKSLTCAVTKEKTGDSHCYNYSKTVYAYHAGSVYQVTYSYTETYASYNEGTITISYVNSSGTTVTLSNVATITYTLRGESCTLKVSDLIAEINGETLYTNDSIVTDKTVLTSVSTMSDGAQLTESFGLDSGAFYADYAASNIMSFLAKDNWGTDSSGNTITNEDMVGKIFRLKQGATNLQANNYVKTGGFYTVYHDEAQGTYSLKAVANVDYRFNTTKTTTKVTTTVTTTTETTTVTTSTDTETSETTTKTTTESESETISTIEFEVSSDGDAASSVTNGPVELNRETNTSESTTTGDDGSTKTVTTTTTVVTTQTTTKTVELDAYARLVNMRMLTVLVNDYNWKSGENSSGNNAHTGTGGTYTITVTAMMHEKVVLDATAVSGGTDEDNNGVWQYTDSDGVAHYYKTETVGDETVYYETDEEGNCIFTDTLRKYQIEVVG